MQFLNFLLEKIVFNFVYFSSPHSLLRDKKRCIYQIWYLCQKFTIVQHMRKCVCFMNCLVGALVFHVGLMLMKITGRWASLESSCLVVELLEFQHTVRANRNFFLMWNASKVEIFYCNKLKRMVPEIFAWPAVGVGRSPYLHIKPFC